jgi:N-methylhydantoinase A
VRAPAIDIAEVGAGGGSLVRLDGGGGLAVGPDSAGAAPGPACYGLGGNVPTVTDANVVLGFINPQALAGGGLALQRDLAVAALERAVATPLGLPLEEAAWGVHRVANAAMARALRAVSTERGRDPREFTLLAFGGNGPVHAATLATLLEIERILVPPVPGLFSALGMLFPEVEHHYVHTHKRDLDGLEAGALEELYGAMEREGAAALAAEGFGAGARRYERQIDLRYAGANAELTVPYPTGSDVTTLLRQSFGATHERQYGYRSDEESVETMNLRVTARGVGDLARVPDRLTVGDGVATSGVSTREVYFGPHTGWLRTAIAARAELTPEWRPGPLLVEEFDSTTVIPPGARARRIAWDAIEIELA